MFVTNLFVTQGRGELCVLILLIVLLKGFCVLGTWQNRHLIRDITLEEGKSWNFGFLTAIDDRIYNSISKYDPVIIYNFEANFQVKSQNMDFHITFIFHEYYHNFKVMICSTDDDENVSARDALMNFPLSQHNNDTPLFRKSCQWIDPVETSVYNTSGPVFLELIRSSVFDFLPERIHLLTEENMTLYNITYEMRTDNVSPRIETNEMWTSNFCNLNGKPILHLANDSWFEYTCQCIRETYGSLCQWGPICSEQSARYLCNNHGTCSAVANFGDFFYYCNCDDDYAGPYCNHFSAFPVVNDCKTVNCHSCHKLPSGEEKCACGIGLRPAATGCIPDSVDVFLSYEKIFDYTITKWNVATKIRRLFSCRSELEDFDWLNHIIIDEKANRIELKNLAILSLYQLSNHSLWSAEGEICAAPSLQASENDTYLMTDYSRGRENENIVEDFLEFSLLRVQFSHTVIVIFHYVFTDHDLKICCQTNSDHFDFNFFKDDNAINMQPLNFRNSNNENWPRGTIEVEYIMNQSYICLLFLNATFIDEGVYKCKVQDALYEEEKELFISKNIKRFEIVGEPEEITVKEGANVTVNCSIVNQSDWSAAQKMSFHPFPPSNFEYYYVRPINALMSSVSIFNIKKDFSVICSTSNELEAGGDYAEKEISVHVLPQSSLFCEANSSYGISWPLTKVNKHIIIKCPNMYIGHCWRDCTLVEDNNARWQVPDCSQCRTKDLNFLYKNLTLYRRGIYSYLLNPDIVLKEIEEVIRYGDVLLPGEMNSVLQTMIECLIKTSQINFKFDDFFSLLNLLISYEHSITEESVGLLKRAVDNYFIQNSLDQYSMRFSSEENLLAYVEVPLLFEVPFNISLPYLAGTNKRFAINKNMEGNPSDNQTKITISLFGYKRTTKMLSAVVYLRPKLFIPYQSKLIGRNFVEETVALRLTDETYLFGEAFSPIIQTCLYYNDSFLSKSQSDSVIVVFQPCFSDEGESFGFSPEIDIYCGRFLPESRIWNTSGCTFSLLDGNKCSCSCKENDGWIGLVRFNPSLQEYLREESTRNLPVTGGCLIALLLLFSTAVVLFIRCSTHTKAHFSRVLEILSLFVTNFIFFYCTVVMTVKNDHLVILMAVSGSLVLTLQISLAHQVDIIHNFNSCSSRYPKTTMSSQPSIMLTMVFGLISALLCCILWTITRVKSISLSQAWLPDGDKASSLTLIILTYISLILLIQSILVALNWLRLKNKLLITSELNEPLKTEFRNQCILGFLKFVFLITSIYRELDIGKYLFAVSTICLAVCLLIFYTCETLWHEGTSKTAEAGEKKKGKISLSQGCFWNWLCSSSVLYTGVAVTDSSVLPQQYLTGASVRSESNIYSEDSNVEQGETSIQEHLCFNKRRFHYPNRPSSSFVHKNDHYRFLNTNSMLNGNALALIEQRKEVEREKAYRVEIHSRTDGKHHRESPTPNGCSLSANHGECSNGTQTQNYLCMKKHKTAVESKPFRNISNNNRKTNASKMYYQNMKYSEIKSKSFNSPKHEKYKNGTWGHTHKNGLSPQKNSINSQNSSFGSKYGENRTSPLTFPRIDKSKKFLSTFSSKFSLIGSKTKKLNRDFSSSNNIEKSNLINTNSKQLFCTKIVSEESVNTRKSKPILKRQHSC